MRARCLYTSSSLVLGFGTELLLALRSFWSGLLSLSQKSCQVG